MILKLTIIRSNLEINGNLVEILNNLSFNDDLETNHDLVRILNHSCF